MLKSKRATIITSNNESFLFKYNDLDEVFEIYLNNIEVEISPNYRDLRSNIQCTVIYDDIDNIITKIILDVTENNKEQPAIINNVNVEQSSNQTVVTIPEKRTGCVSIICWIFVFFIIMHLIGILFS